MRTLGAANIPLLNTPTSVAGGFSKPSNGVGVWTRQGKIYTPSFQVPIMNEGDSYTGKFPSFTMMTLVRNPDFYLFSHLLPYSYLISLILKTSLLCSN